MAAKIYTCLLLLFPSDFREAYGGASLQLFRDRARDERGFVRTLGLGLNLLADLAISIPREYRRVRSALVGAAVQQRLQGPPSSFVLGEELRGAGAPIFGCAVSIVALSLFSILLGHARNHRPPSTSPGQSRAATGARPSAFRRPRAPAADELTAAERQRVTNAVIQNLKKHYVDSEVARKTADALLVHQNNGDDDKVTDGRAFADLLTKQIREVSYDLHLEVVYSQEPLPELLPEPTAEDIARYRKALEQDNCTFKKLEIRPHNIGYMKLNAFPDPSLCRATATAAMASLNHAYAIIFDLRDNRGGYSSMVSLIAAYLFDHPEYLYDPRESPAPRSWTLSPVAGNRLADKPVYVLTSGSTISAAEQFCYDLKMLKRVTLVGERTRGSAHAGVFHRIDDHFGMGIPEARAINPYAKTDWEGTGVEPDVKVKAADALETAEKLAENRLKKKH